MAKDTKAGIAIKTVKVTRYQVTGPDGRKLKSFATKSAATAYREGLVRGMRGTQKFLGEEVK